MEHPAIVGLLAYLMSTGFGLFAFLYPSPISLSFFLEHMRTHLSCKDFQIRQFSISFLLHSSTVHHLCAFSSFIFFSKFLILINNCTPSFIMPFLPRSSTAKYPLLTPSLLFNSSRPCNSLHRPCYALLSPPPTQFLTRYGSRLHSHHRPAIYLSSLRAISHKYSSNLNPCHRLVSHSSCVSLFWPC